MFVKLQRLRTKYRQLFTNNSFITQSLALSLALFLPLFLPTSLTLIGCRLANFLRASSTPQRRRKLQQFTAAMPGSG